jgi:hypothetical protein
MQLGHDGRTLMDQLGYAILWTAEAERRTDCRRSTHANAALELLHQRDQRVRLVPRERSARLGLHGRLGKLHRSIGRTRLAMLVRGLRDRELDRRIA